MKCKICLSSYYLIIFTPYFSQFGPFILEIRKSTFFYIKGPTNNFVLPLTQAGFKNTKKQKIYNYVYIQKKN